MDSADPSFYSIYIKDDSCKSENDMQSWKTLHELADVVKNDAFEEVNRVRFEYCQWKRVDCDRFKL